jgi:PAS domain-containing protein
MSTSGISRLRVPIVKRLKAQLSRMKSASLPPKFDETLDDAASLYDSLLRDLGSLELENDALRSRIRALEGDWDYLFHTMAIPCVMTDTSGKILRGNDRAGALLNTSVRHLEQQNVPLMYFAQDRQTFFGVVTALSSANCEDARATLLIRPRERAPITADVIAVPRTADDTTVWLWFLLTSARSTTDTVQ